MSLKNRVSNPLVNFSDHTNSTRITKGAAAVADRETIGETDAHTATRRRITVNIEQREKVKYTSFNHLHNLVEGEELGTLKVKGR